MYPFQRTVYKARLYTVTFALLQYPFNLNLHAVVVVGSNSKGIYQLSKDNIDAEHDMRALVV